MKFLLGCNIKVSLIAGGGNEPLVGEIKIWWAVY